MQNWYSRLSLRTKISGIALAITAMSLAVVAAAGILQIHHQIAVEERRSADAVALSFSRSAELAMTVGDKRELARLTTSYGHDPNLLFVATYDANGKLLTCAASDQSAWEHFLRKKLDPETCIISRRTVEALDQTDDFGSATEATTISGPVAAKTTKPVGTIVIGLSTADQLRAQASQNLLTIAVTVVAAIIGGTVLFLTPGGWMRRLQRLAEASRAISMGNFSGEISDHTDDEIGRLAQSFDDMRAALRRREDELRQLTDTLQDQVRMRTKDLQTALTAAEDANMPKTDGMELASTIKNNPATRDVILISLSSISDQIKKEQMSEHGFAACLTKPVLPSQLYDTIVTSLAANESDQAPATITAKPVDRLDGVRVLLAEDNEVNRLVATELLQLIGCTVSVAVNGYEAVQLAMREQFDIMLMDCQMPVLDGFEATRTIRKAECEAGKGEHRKIIALTANAIKGDRELCLEAGMDDYLTKPIEPADLMRTIHALLPAGRAAEVKSAAPTASATTDKTAPVIVPDHAPVDLESLQRRCVDNRRLAAKALRMFDGGIDRDLEALSNSVKARDPKAVAASAHKIKGAAANISAEDVRKVAAELEKLGRADSLETSEAALESLNQQISAFRHYLDTALRELTPPETPSSLKNAK